MFFSRILRQLSPELRSACYKSPYAFINISITDFYQGPIYPGETAVIARCNWNNGSATETFSLRNDSDVIIYLKNLHFESYVLVSEIWEYD